MWERVFNPGVRGKHPGTVRPDAEYIGGRCRRGNTDFQNRGKFRAMMKRRAKAGRRVPVLYPVRNEN